MKKFILTAITVLLSGAFSVFAQTPAVPLETILTEAQKQSENYRETFKNLLADETKTFEEFDKSGESDSITVVKSSFLVYQSGKNAFSTAELRNVLEVNGKPVPDSQRRGEEFLAELEKQTTLESELKKLQKESAKFDKTWLVYGLTLNQAVALFPNLRPAFDFQFAGAEVIDGHDVYVVRYQQKTKSPYITVNEKEKAAPDRLTVNFDISIPGELRKTNLFLRGRLWIDAKTFQIRREERELVARTDDPVMLLSSTFDYQPSEFEILVPKKISLTVFTAKKEKNGEKFSSLRDASVNLEYSKFRKTNVEVRILDDDIE